MDSWLNSFCAHCSSESAMFLIRSNIIRIRYLKIKENKSVDYTFYSGKMSHFFVKNLVWLQIQPNQT